MKTTLLIMAAGIGSRYGAGVKQLAKVDNHDHIIMDYSIHDAIEAGFNKIVFVIRKDIEADFKDAIGNRIESVCAKHGVEVHYCFQDIRDIPAIPGVTTDRHGYIKIPNERTKPWGTGHAVLTAREIIKEHYAVINADDYYGKQAFRQVYEFLTSDPEDNEFCLAGYRLENTLSDHGAVSRGVCSTDENMNLTQIIETRNIRRTDHGIYANELELDPKSFVSMNMWGLTRASLEMFHKGFVKFFKHEVLTNPEKAEYLIPIYIGRQLDYDKVNVKVLETSDQWFGVTYAEDKEYVVSCFSKLIEDGVYSEDLYSDL